jgi:hypothetical protein
MHAFYGALERMIPQVEKGGYAGGDFENDAAAFAAVAAVGTASGNEFLAPEADTAVAAIAALHGDFYSIDEHECDAGSCARLPN